MKQAFVSILKHVVIVKFLGKEYSETHKFKMRSGL